MKTNNQISFESAGKNVPFTVPENYFENFAAQFDQKIGFQPAKRKIFRSWMYAAAAVIVGIAVLTPLMYTRNAPTATSGTDNYESYVLSQVDEGAMIDYYVDQHNNN